MPAERCREFFEFDGEDPFMTIAPRARPEKAHLIPAGVHVDETGRIQTVRREANPRYYDLLVAFDRLTGVPVLLNTSFNEQEPIVARPEEAIDCFLRTGMDVLVLGNCHVTSKAASVASADGRRAGEHGREVDGDAQRGKTLVSRLANGN
jgi:carbamoyltransferase